MNDDKLINESSADRKATGLSLFMAGSHRGETFREPCSKCAQVEAIMKPCECHNLASSSQKKNFKAFSRMLTEARKHGVMLCNAVLLSSINLLYCVFCLFRWGPTSVPVREGWTPTAPGDTCTTPKLKFSPPWTKPPSVCKWAPTRGRVRYWNTFPHKSGITGLGWKSASGHLLFTVLALYWVGGGCHVQTCTTLWARQQLTPDLFRQPCRLSIISSVFFNSKQEL